jgi:acyl-CoA hydrolase
MAQDSARFALHMAIEKMNRQSNNLGDIHHGSCFSRLDQGGTEAATQG